MAAPSLLLTQLLDEQGADLAVPAGPGSAPLWAAARRAHTPLVTRVGRIELGAGALVAALLFALAAPLLPPVPVAVTAAATGTGIRNREIEGAAERFPAGTKRVYAWFAVHVPLHYRQGIRFEWYRDGEKVGNVAAREIIGGREQGFRTSSSTSSPKSGSWRVDLLTDASQLIARSHFVVE